jgi:branched-chain amino acid aminotransferase
MPDLDLPFGRHFTDHMLEINWDFEHGWHNPAIIPYGPIKIAPTATSLHYGISAYEGISSMLNEKTKKP